MKMDEPMALPAIRCDVTMDDIVAFNEYHMLLSPMALRQRAQMIRIFTTIFVVEFGLVGIFVRGILPPEVGWWGWLLPPLCALVFGGGAFFAVRASFNRRKKRLSNWMRNRIRKLYSEGENKSVLCEHVLEVSESGFTERTAYNENRYAWGALERIETTADHTFLFIGAIQAIIIPHNAVTEGDLPAFLRAIGTHYKPHQVLDTATSALPAPVLTHSLDGRKDVDQTPNESAPLLLGTVNRENDPL